MQQKRKGGITNALISKRIVSMEKVVCEQRKQRNAVSSDIHSIFGKIRISMVIIIIRYGREPVIHYTWLPVDQRSRKMNYNDI